MFIKHIFQGLLICSFLFFCGCSHEKAKNIKTVKVFLKSGEKTLYYTGTLEPREVYSVQNINEEGIITAKYFDYGTRIENNQILFKITSKQLGKDYQDALTAYLKAKKSFVDAQHQMQTENELNKLKIVSQDELRSTQTQLFNAQLDFEQATNAIYNLMEVAHIPKSRLEKLDSSDPQAVNKALISIPYSYKIISPASGIALFPKGVGGESGELKAGSTAKAGSVLVLINNKNGVAITLKVNQLSISDIKYNEKALITGDAFPGITLIGLVNHIDREASTDPGSTLPIFSVRVIVPQLTSQEYNAVRIGMTCEVAIKIQTPPLIKVPLSAVYQNENQSYVDVFDIRTKKIIHVPVQTGMTEEDQIEIIDGLKSGDEVLVNAANH